MPDLRHDPRAKAGTRTRPRRARRAMTRWLASLAIGIALSGCVAEDAGYSDVRNLVGERARAKVRWNHIEGKPPAEEVDRLLARPLSADDAVKVALFNNPDLQANFEDLGVARA